MSYYYYTQVGRADSFSDVQFGPCTDHQLSEFLAGDGECTRQKTLTEAEQEWLQPPALTCFPPHPMERFNIHIISIAGNHGSRITFKNAKEDSLQEKKHAAQLAVLLLLVLLQSRDDTLKFVTGFFVIPTFARRCCLAGTVVHERGARPVAEDVELLEDIAVELLMRAHLQHSD